MRCRYLGLMGKHFGYRPADLDELRLADFFSLVDWVDVHEATVKATAAEGG